MSKPLTEDQRARLREEASRQFDEAQRLQQATGKTGWRARLTMWERAKIETTKKNYPVLAGTATFLKYTVAIPLVALGKFSNWAIPRMVTKKDKTRSGHRSFAPFRSVVWAATLTTGYLLRTYLAMGAYYYGTYRTSEIYVPNAGVFLNQQFERPNVPGRIATPRDQIYTVHGSVLEKDGSLEGYFGVIDSDLYFPLSSAAFNPGQVATHMTPISEHGALCKIYETGGYVPFPRALKPMLSFARNILGAQREILGASCQQLKEIPPQFRIVDAPQNGQKIPSQVTQPVQVLPAAPAAPTPPSMPAPAASLPPTPAPGSKQ